MIMTSHPQFNIWNILYYNFTFIPHALLNTHTWQAPNISGFIAQLVRASHRYRELTDSNPIKVLTFWGFYILSCINCVYNYKDHRLLDFKSAVQYMKYLTYITSTFIPHRLLRTHNWLAPNFNGFIAQLLRASHRCSEVTGSNPVKVLTFSGFYIRNSIDCLHNCEGHTY